MRDVLQKNNKRLKMQYSFATHYLMGVSSSCVLTIVLLFLDVPLTDTKMKPSENEREGAPKSGQSNCVVESGTKPAKVMDGGWGWVVMAVSFVHWGLSESLTSN